MSAPSASASSSSPSAPAAAAAPSDERSSRVFVSYVCKDDGRKPYDSSTLIREFVTALRQDFGFDARMDDFAGPVGDWVEWMRLEIDNADYVLFVPTAEYLRRSRLTMEQEPRGVTWEAKCITSRMMRDAAFANRAVRPVMFKGPGRAKAGELGAAHIPNPWPTHRFEIDLTDAEGPKQPGMQLLAEFLSGHHRHLAPRINPIRFQPPTHASQASLFAPRSESLAVAKAAAQGQP